MNKAQIEKITIQKVNKDSEMASKLINFIENFSWIAIKDHMLKMVQNWEFIEWETPFVATIDNAIIGMATIMKCDYYNLSDIYPWVSSVFVSEEYRGNKISKKLIDFANEYAKDIGFKRTYIPTKFVGLYEKYGYKYIKDIINLDGANRHLYVRDL